MQKIESLYANKISRFAHDISSPITVMEIGLQLMDKDADDNCVMLKLAAQRMRYLVEDLINVSDEVEMALIPIKSVLEEAVDIKSYELVDRDCIFHLSFKSGTELSKVYCIPDELKRVLSNLLDNSIESCTKAGFIDVSVDMVEKYIEISLLDNGIGMSKEQMHRVLTGESLKHPGKGLGLMSAQEYTQRTGGYFSIKSKEHVGTCVVLKLLGSM